MGSGLEAAQHATVSSMHHLRNLTLLKIIFFYPVVDCGRVPDIEHGQIKYPEGTTLYRQVWYSCLTGYELIGSEFRSCSTNGQWVPPPPTCKRECKMNFR